MALAHPVLHRVGGGLPLRHFFPKVIRPGLDNVSRALDLLGHPEESFATVLVAGTNGKGSVSAMIESGLRRAGYRTGLYTSPHLVNVRERTQIRGTPVGPAAWVRATHRVAAMARKHRLPLTEFEAQTLASFLEFESRRVEIAVLEVGLGGRLDAVNAVAAPELCVITSIGLDHTAWLGPTLRHIYFEKRGIARKGTILVQDLPKSLHREAERFGHDRGVPSWTLDQEIRCSASRVKRASLGQWIHVRLPDGLYEKVWVPFWGDHQARNGALAVAALHVLRRQGWGLNSKNILEGISRARWPGRFEVLQRNPPVVLDGAHNPAAAHALARAWKAAPWGRRKATLIFSCLKDKDLNGIASALIPVARRVIVTGLVSERACPVPKLAALWRRRLPTETASSFRTAWRRATADDQSPVLVAGSLYLVGEAMKVLRRRI
jgi:dihydrofolate synthase/folylpolyglutamate synthase